MTTSENGRRIGYARVSTSGQSLDIQLAALKSAGCDRVFSEKVSGKSTDKRTQMKAALAEVGAGDVLVVTKLDRLGRNLRDVVVTVYDIVERGAHIRVLDQNVDTTTDTGRIMIHLFGLFAEIERGFILARTEAGRQAAREQGRTGGRKPKLSAHQVKQLRADAEQTDAGGKAVHTVTALAAAYGISRPAVYRYLKEGNN